MDNFYLIVYVMAWGLLSYAQWRKTKSFDVILYIYVSVFFFSCISYLLYNDKDSMFAYKGLTFFPFVYLFFMIFISSYPVKKYCSRRYTEIVHPDKFRFYLFIGFYLFFSLLSIPSVLANLYKLPYLFLESSAGLDAYRSSIEANELDQSGSISNLPAIFTGLYFNLSGFLLIYLLTLKPINKWLVGGVAFSILSGMISYLVSGQRGGVFHALISIITAYFVLKKFLSERTNMLLRRIGIVFIFLLSIPILYITISRFGEASSSGTNPLSSLYFYMGQSSLYFNKFGLDDNGIRYGDRTFSYFKILLGFDDVPRNFWEGRIKYPHLSIGDEVFSSYVGDFTIDFGPYWALLLFVVFTLFLTHWANRPGKAISFTRLMLIFLLSNLIVDGVMFLYPYGYEGNLKIFFYILTLLFFRIKLSYHHGK